MTDVEKIIEESRKQIDKLSYTHDEVCNLDKYLDGDVFVIRGDAKICMAHAVREAVEANRERIRRMSIKEVDAYVARNGGIEAVSFGLSPRSLLILGTSIACDTPTGDDDDHGISEINLIGGDS